MFVWICRLSLPLGVCEGLQFVIEVLPGLSLTFFSPEETPTRDVLKFDFRNKGLAAVNISNILNHKKVTSIIGFLGSTIGFHLLWHTVELARSTRLC